MILVFLGDDYTRQLAEIYIINFYGFNPISPRDNILDGIRCIFDFSDSQLYGEDFDRPFLGGPSPREWSILLEEEILLYMHDYFERTIMKQVEIASKDNDVKHFVVRDMSNNPDMFQDSDDFFAIGLNNYKGDLNLEFDSNKVLFKELDLFLEGKGLKKTADDFRKM